MVIVTSTGAWFRCPAALGSVSDTSTVIVAAPDPLPLPFPFPFPFPDEDDDEEDELEATVLIWEITPGVADPSGSVIETLLPTATSLCSEASRSIVTTGVSELAVSTTDPAAADPPGTAPVPRPVTWIALGRNTAWPSGSDPVSRQPQVRLQQPQRVRGLAAEVIPARDRAQRGRGGVAEFHQVRVQFPHVAAGHALRQVTVGRDAPVQQHHRRLVGLVEHLSLPDDLPGLRQRGERLRPRAPRRRPAPAGAR